MPTPASAPNEDFELLTSLIRDLWPKSTYSERSALLRALEAACHHLGLTSPTQQLKS